LRTIFALAALPLFCLLGFAIILVVIVYLVVRNIRSSATSISSSSPDAKNTDADNSGNDSRWARADLSPSHTQVSTKLKGKPCPACGGENPIGAGQCEFCGSKLI
jgi:ribosomal protein L40E